MWPDGPSFDHIVPAVPWETIETKTKTEMMIGRGARVGVPAVAVGAAVAR